MAERSDHLFVVRIWREAGKDSNGQWRGSVDHVGSGRKQYFATTSDLVEFVMQRLEEPHEQ